MLYTNVNGKLLIFSAASLQRGTGWVLKLPASHEYANVVRNEYRIMERIGKLDGPRALVPACGLLWEEGEVPVAKEEDVEGESLEDILKDLGLLDDELACVRLLDAVDRWYRTYASAFPSQNGGSLGAHYESVLDLFTRAYGRTDLAQWAVAFARAELVRLEGCASAVPSVISHGDLWPANFVKSGSRWVVIDWERAREGQAPFFDHCWMLVSTAIERRRNQARLPGYGEAFRAFRRTPDGVDLHARGLIERFLAEHGFPPEAFPLFFLLFAMEWSVLGYSVTGVPSAMDRVAHAAFEDLCSDLREERSLWGA
jgi:aminoglycoside phosphotransferase (APT) family kinase protein